MEPLTKVLHRQLTQSSSDVTQQCCRLELPLLCYSWFLVSPQPAPCVSRGVETAVMDHSAGSFPYNWLSQQQGKCFSHRTTKKRSKGRQRELDSPLQTWPSVADLHWTHPPSFPKGCALTRAGAKHSKDAIRSTACTSQSSSSPLAWEGQENRDSHENRLFEASSVPRERCWWSCRWVLLPVHSKRGAPKSTGMREEIWPLVFTLQPFHQPSTF